MTPSRHEGGDNEERKRQTAGHCSAAWYSASLNPAPPARPRLNSSVWTRRPSNTTAPLWPRRLRALVRNHLGIASRSINQLTPPHYIRRVLDGTHGPYYCLETHSARQGRPVQMRGSVQWFVKRGTRGIGAIAAAGATISYRATPRPRNFWPPILPLVSFFLRRLS